MEHVQTAAERKCKNILGCASVLSVKACAIILLQALESVGLHMYTDALRTCAVSPTTRATIISGLVCNQG